MLKVPDAISAQMIMEQYTYAVYADYDVLIRWKDRNHSHLGSGVREKRILVFLNDVDGDYASVADFFSGYRMLHVILFKYSFAAAPIPLVFSISREFLWKYIDYVMIDFPQIISSDLEKEHLIELGGCSLYNSYYLLQMCYYNQITVGQIESRDMAVQREHAVDDEKLICILSMLAIGIHKKLALLILNEDKLNDYLDEQYIFSNADYILPNISMHLFYKRNFKSDLSVWDVLDCYIEALENDEDNTIIEQVSWILRKTIESGYEISENLKEKIFRMEGKLHRVFRFLRNPALLKLESLCKRIFENDLVKYSYILVNEAILYEDVEDFNVAKEKFLKVMEFCNQSSDTEVKVYAMDEFSRLLEKTGSHFEALEKLYFVENYYKDRQDVKKLQNVQNRIGLNLCFTGNIQKAIVYLERLHFDDFGGKIYGDRVLSCEVANNLSICYMETGSFDSALHLQDQLYRMYLTIDHAPVNYATDILQNKGSVYLYQYKYKDAMLCFKQALQDEKNPFSRELILENYLYAKAFHENDFDESVHFFESKIRQSTNYESCKMLAELYYAGEFYEECCCLCGRVLKEISYEKNQILYFSFDLFWVKSMTMLNKLTLKQKLTAKFRLKKYQRFILENIGNHSPYYRELEGCKEMI